MNAESPASRGDELSRGVVLGALVVVVIVGVALAFVGVFEGDDGDPARLTPVSPALGQVEVE